MIARMAGHSFGKIQNCLENTISKMCASAANVTARSRAMPATPRPPSPHLPRWEAPASALRSAHLRSAAFRAGERGGEESTSQESTFLSCKRFPWWSGPLLRSRGSLDEPWTFQELNENPIHKRVLAEGLHHHHPLLPQHVQHPGDVQRLQENRPRG